MLPRLKARSIALLATGFFLACNGDAFVPGDEVIGRFAFTAELVDHGCTDFNEVPAGDSFTFEGIFSRRSDGSGAWLTLGKENRDGAWDGQRFDSTHSAPRRFEVDKCDNRFVVEERLHVAILSASQDVALGGECPEDGAALLADGAVPLDADAGVVLPGPLETGYDSVRACGVLTDRVTPERDCVKPVDCTFVWRVTGGRRQ